MVHWYTVFVVVPLGFFEITSLGNFRGSKYHSNFGLLSCSTGHSSSSMMDSRNSLVLALLEEHKNVCVACDFVFVSSTDHSIQDIVVAIGFSPFQFLGPLFCCIVPI